MFENLKARLDQLLRSQGRDDPRARAAALREAVLDAKVGVSTMRSALGATEQELAQERRQLADAERRRRLAAELPDPETASVAQRYMQRHRERVGVLERKLTVQRDELALAEKELAEMLAEYRRVQPEGSSASIDAAWRDLQAAGGERPGLDLDEQQRPPDADDKLKQAIEAQLAYLKKKLGKDPGERP